MLFYSQMECVNPNSFFRFLFVHLHWVSLPVQPALCAPNSFLSFLYSNIVSTTGTACWLPPPSLICTLIQAMPSWVPACFIRKEQSWMQVKLNVLNLQPALSIEISCFQPNSMGTCSLLPPQSWFYQRTWVIWLQFHWSGYIAHIVNIPDWP